MSRFITALLVIAVILTASTTHSDELQLERAKLAAKFGEQHPSVRTLDQQLAVRRQQDLKGIFLVSIETETKALIDPSTMRIGDRLFLRGIVSGKLGDLLKESPFSGSAAFLPVDRIVSIQEVKTPVEQ